ncbi:MAG: hypothetical protein NVS2B16_30560 [Chloroflexota bacterium]
MLKSRGRLRRFPPHVLEHLKRGEGQYQEFKQQLPTDPGTLARSIAALANGGWTKRWAELWIGVTDSGAMYGVEQGVPPGIERIQRRAIQRALSQIHPRPRVRVQRGLGAGRMLIRLQIDTLGPAHHVANNYYVRDNNANYRLTDKADVHALRQRRLLRPSRLFRSSLVWLLRGLLLILGACCVGLFLPRLIPNVVWTLAGQNTGPTHTNVFMEAVAESAGHHMIAYRGFEGGADYIVVNPSSSQIEQILRPNNQAASRDFDIDPAGQELLFARDGVIWHTALQTGTTIALPIKGGSASLRLPRYAPDGSGFFVVSDTPANQVGWVDPASLTLQPLRGDTGVGAGRIDSLAISRDLQTLILHVQDDGQNRLIRTSMDWARLTVNGSAPFWQTASAVAGVAVSRDGRWAYIGLEQRRLWAIEAIDTRTGTSYPASAFAERFPRLTRDGATLLASAQRTVSDYQVVRVNPTPQGLLIVCFRIERVVAHWARLVFTLLLRHPQVVLSFGVLLVIAVLRWLIFYLVI